MPFTIDITGADALTAALADYPRIFDEEMEQASAEAFDLLRSPLREYPPERDLQRYVRTFKLRDAWDDAQPQYEAAADGFTARLANPTDYGPYVQGGADDDPHQAYMHQGYWNTDDAIVQDNEAEVKGIFQQHTDRTVQRLGGTP